MVTRLTAIVACMLMVGPVLASPRRHSDAEWPSVKTQVVSGKVEDIAFTIELPVDLEDKEPRNRAVRQWQNIDDYYAQPHFDISVFWDPFPATVAEGEKALHMPRADVMKSELTSDHYVYLTKTNTFVSAQILIRVGKRALLCNAAKSNAAGMTDQDAFGPWLVKVCTTMKPR
jgi:hypothetical protein